MPDKHAVVFAFEEQVVHGVEVVVGAEIAAGGDFAIGGKQGARKNLGGFAGAFKLAVPDGGKGNACGMEEGRDGVDVGAAEIGKRTRRVGVRFECFAVSHEVDAHVSSEAPQTIVPLTISGRRALRKRPVLRQAGMIADLRSDRYSAQNHC